MVYHQRPVGQAVKTSPSHGENRSSILLRVTIDLRTFPTGPFLNNCFLQFIVGVYYEKGPPVPIPNTVVKLFCAEDTWRVAAWKNRSSPTLKASIYIGA